MTAIPFLVPPPSGQTWRPWLTPAMFRGYPHWLDLDDLLQGFPGPAQDDAVADNLLAATDWAVGELGDMRLDGHLVSGEERRARILPDGRVKLLPRDVPLRAVISLSVGPDPSDLSPLPLPDATMQVTSGGRVLSFRAPASLRRRCREVFVTWSYLAGYPLALLTAPVAGGASSVTVDDPASILPGDVLRCYDPGVTENFTVASSCVPVLPTWPPAATSIPLAAAAQHSHLAETGVTGFPRRALQAVIAYTVALLMREDVSDQEPASGFGPDARTTAPARGGMASGLVNDAYGWLNDFKQIIRSG